MSVRLYVGNLPKDIDRTELEGLFADAGDLTSTKLIVDRKTGKSRGFAFVTVGSDEEADRLIEKFNGQSFKEVELKIEKAMPRKGKGEDEEGGSSDAPTPSAAPSHSPAAGNHGGGGGGNPARSASSSNNNRRRDNNKKARRGSGGAVVAESSTATAQPDPRWAGELEKLKQLLAAQATTP